jgi:hypothetical protein
MLTPKNFSDRHQKSLSTFAKAHDELQQLHIDLVNEEETAAKHLAALKARREAVEQSLNTLRPLVGQK